MKRILLLLFIILVSLNLSAGTIVKIASKTGLWLTISKGTGDGVKIGMKGRVQKIFADGEEKIPFTLGIFVVKKVTGNSAELYIQQVAGNADLKEAVQVEFYGTLKKKLSPRKKFAWLKSMGNRYIKRKNFKRAASVLRQAFEINPRDPEVNKLSEGLALINVPQISYRDFLQYKAENPSSPLLKDLKEKFYNTYPGLPPWKYLDKTANIIKNSKGYYEVEFKNSHVMIYLPRIKLFVDKYEVSNSQYLKFTGAKGSPVEVLNFSTLKNYPYCCKDYPAIVSYEQAEEYCKANKMRLPTEEEWEIIAGRSKGEFPWGNTGPDDANVYRANFESLGDKYIELAPVDSFLEFASPCGAVNMAGNVPEWVKTKLNKGGGFLSEKEDLKITNHSEDTAYVGFRCVMEVKNDPS